VFAPGALPLTPLLELTVPDPLAALRGLLGVGKRGKHGKGRGEETKKEQANPPK